MQCDMLAHLVKARPEQVPRVSYIWYQCQARIYDGFEDVQVSDSTAQEPLSHYKQSMLLLLYTTLSNTSLKNSRAVEGKYSRTRYTRIIHDKSEGLLTRPECPNTEEANDTTQHAC